MFLWTETDACACIWKKIKGIFLSQNTVLPPPHHSGPKVRAVLAVSSFLLMFNSSPVPAGATPTYIPNALISLHFYSCYPIQVAIVSQPGPWKGFLSTLPTSPPLSSPGSSWRHEPLLKSLQSSQWLGILSKRLSTVVGPCKAATGLLPQLRRPWPPQQEPSPAAGP